MKKIFFLLFLISCSAPTLQEDPELIAIQHDANNVREALHNMLEQNVTITPETRDELEARIQAIPLPDLEKEALWTALDQLRLQETPVLVEPLSNNNQSLNHTIKYNTSINVS